MPMTIRDQNLQQVLTSQQTLKLAKAKPITFSKPLLSHEGKPIIYPNTINVIQGQAGVHKSRLAETLCSALLLRPDCKTPLLGFKRESVLDLNTTTVVYVDTERNLKDQLPYALQSIQVKAGYQIEDDPPNFEYISLLQINRGLRFEALDVFLEHLRKRCKNHLFIVLDVSTDCISDFNHTGESMKLIDLMNVAINEYNVTFLCLIHENPKSDKARGHLGTEILNKASTVIQVGYEKEAGNRDSNILCIRYLKCRSTERHAPVYAKYCNVEKGLILASNTEIADVSNSRRQKADIEEMAGYIQGYFSSCDTIKRRELLDMLMSEFAAKEKTVENRLKEIVESQYEFVNSSENSCSLKKEQKGKEVFYVLEPIKAE